MKEKIQYILDFNEKIAKRMSESIPIGFCKIVHPLFTFIIFQFVGRLLYLPFQVLLAPVKGFVIFSGILSIIRFAIIIIMVAIMIVLVYKAEQIFGVSYENKHTSFGKARFSRLKEVLATGLTGDGIVFGKLDNHLITKPPKVEGHTLIVGGTGTGKSRGVVIPTLFLWNESAFVIDIKGELSKITKANRAKFGKVYIFAPEKENCSCYDPIKLCTTVEQAQTLARTLIPIPEKGDSFWTRSAQGLLSAYVLEGARKGRTLTDIAYELCLRPIKDIVDHCRTNEIKEVKLLASTAYDIPDKTLGNLMAELKSHLLTIATDENIRKATSRSDWTPETLEENSTVYLQVSEHLLEQYKDLWTIIVNQVLRHLSKREENRGPSILIALDEMPRLSKIEGLTSALATLRSRNVHIVGIIQSMAQLDLIYGEHEKKVIADNCRFKFVLSATDPDTQKYFSDLAGQKTVLAQGKSVGSDIIPNYSESEQGTPLIRPEEWANLDNPILFAPKLQPVPLKMAWWDKEGFDSKN